MNPNNNQPGAALTVQPRSQPRLSVIVTCFNVDKYLVECLDSVTRQTLEDIEIIVVDDGSTDTTPSIIQRYAEQDPRIVPILMEDNSPGGVSTAANIGLNRASGTYVGFVDGDDFCRATAFERLVGVIESGDADLAMCRFELFHEGPPLSSFDPEFKRWEVIDRELYQLTDDEKLRFLSFAPAPWRKIYRRDFLERNIIRFPEVDYFYEDVPFHWYCILNAQSIAVLPEVHFFHRTGRPGQTESAVDERLLRMFDHHWHLREWLEQRHLAEQYNPALISWVLSQIEGVGRQCRGDLRRQLFDLLVGIVRAHPINTVEAARKTLHHNKMALALTESLLSKDFETFERLVRGPHKSSPIASVIFHLRALGIASTCALAFERFRRSGTTSELVRARDEWIARES